MQTEDTRIYNLGVELSENKHYLQLENTICYYNYPNANGREMDYGETEEEQAATLAMAQTLVNMPVKAKYTVNAQGLPTFKGHEAKRLPGGEMTTATEKIGTHTKVWIEEKEVTTFDGKQMTLPCLIAQQVVWKDNKNVVAAIKRLFSLDKLNSSWEVDVSNYEYRGGIKYLKEYSFLGNAFLGYEYAQPAYGQDAKVVSIASQEEEDCDYEMMIAEALSRDIIENEVNKLNKDKDKQKQAEGAQEPEQSAEQPKENPTAENGKPEASTVKTPEEGKSEQSEVSKQENPETSAQTEQGEPKAENPQPEHSEDKPENPEGQLEHSTLTEQDINRKLWTMLRDKVGWGWVMFHFPEQHIVWYHKEDALETQFIQVTYEVTDNDVVILSMEDMQFDLPVQELPGALAEKDKQLAEKDKELSELRAYKEQHEQAEAEAKKVQHAQEVASLRKLAQDADCFTEDEMSSTEMSELFENVKVAEVKAMIFDRKMAAAEVAEVGTPPAPKRQLEDDVSATKFDRVGAMRGWLLHK